MTQLATTDAESLPSPSSSPYAVQGVLIKTEGFHLNILMNALYICTADSTMQAVRSCPIWPYLVHGSSGQSPVMCPGE